jgi:hypothetical protein
MTRLRSAVNRFAAPAPSEDLRASRASVSFRLVVGSGVSVSLVIQGCFGDGVVSRLLSSSFPSWQFQSSPFGSPT